MDPPIPVLPIAPSETTVGVWISPLYNSEDKHDTLIIDTRPLLTEHSTSSIGDDGRDRRLAFYVQGEQMSVSAPQGNTSSSFPIDSNVSQVIPTRILRLADTHSI